MQKIKCTLLSTLALFIYFTFALPASAAELQKQLTSESAIEAIMKRGKMRVGMSTFVPWAMRNKEGELIGFEIDVAKKVAELVIL